MCAVSERWRTDENQNPIHDADQLPAVTSLQAPLGYGMDLSDASNTQVKKADAVTNKGSMSITVFIISTRERCCRSTNVCKYAPALSLDGTIASFYF